VKNGAPDGSAVLLLHGFAGSPFEMRELGQRLERRGLAISTPALPGHATKPDDLLRIKADDYFAAAEAAWDETARRADRVYVVGLSMGGSLGLHLAATRPVAGLVTISTPLQASKLVSAGAPLLERIHPQLPVPSRIGVRLSGDEGYSSIPISSVGAFLQVLERVRARIAHVRSPLLVIHSIYDPTIPVENARLIHAGVASTDRSLHITKRGLHLLTRPRYVGSIEPAIGDFIERLERAHAEPVPTDL
jgi:carboxylesterase